MQEKKQTIIICLLVIQIAVIFWGVWYIITNPERRLEKDCSNFLSTLIDINPNMSSDTMFKISADCYKQGGSKEWQWSKDINQMRDDITDITKRLNIN